MRQILGHWMTGWLLCAIAVSAALAADPDPSTPAGAQKAARQAAEKGDKQALRKLLHGANPTEEKLADALADNAIAGAAAYKAAVAKFGEEEVRRTLLDVVPIQPKEADEEKREWKIEGDKASVVTVDKSQSGGPALTRIAGVWKLSMSEITTGRSEAEINQMITVLQKQGEMMTAQAKEVQEGKYASASELRKVALERMQKLMSEVVGPTTTTAGEAATTTTAPSGGK